MEEYEHNIVDAIFHAIQNGHHDIVEALTDHLNEKLYSALLQFADGNGCDDEVLLFVDSKVDIQSLFCNIYFTGYEIATSKMYTKYLSSRDTISDELLYKLITTNEVRWKFINDLISKFGVSVDLYIHLSANKPRHLPESMLQHIKINIRN